MQDEKLTINHLYEIIDLCKYASVDGETVEIIFNSNSDNTREISIGLKGGFSQDKYHFSFENGEEFDKSILPLLINRFLLGDSVSSWTVQESEINLGTTKSLINTKEENEFLIQTLNDNLVKELREKVEVNNIEESLEEKIELTDNEKVCGTVLRYVSGNLKNNKLLENLNEIEKKDAIELLEKAYSVKKSYTDEELLAFMRENRDDNSVIVDKIMDDIVNNNSSLVDKVKKFIKDEQRYSNYMDEESFLIRKKVAMQMARNGYFSTRLNFPKGTNLEMLNSESLEDLVSKNSKSKYNVLLNSKLYYVENKMMEEAAIVDEFISYLVKKQKLSLVKKEIKEKKQVEVKKEIVNENISLTETSLNKGAVIEDFSILADTYSLCEGAKVDNEKVLVKVFTDEIDKTKRKVEISLTEGMSRDSYEYIFENGENFDKEILPKIISMMTIDEKVLSAESAQNTISNRDNILLSLENGNQCLINIDGIRKEDVDKYLNNDKENKLPSSISNFFEKQINNSNKKDESNFDTVTQDDVNSNKVDVNEDKPLTFDELATLLEKEILTYHLDKDIRDENRFSDKFEELHYLAKRYQPLLSSSGDTIIYDRETKLEYIPKDDSEREKIEFATYWGVTAGVASSRDDLFPGEMSAFGEDAKKIFNIMNVHFEESIKRGIDIDLESLQRQFANSGYNKANLIFDRLFKDKDYVDEITLYYKRQLDDTKIDKSLEENIVVENKEIKEFDNIDNYLEEYYDENISRDVDVDNLEVISNEELSDIDEIKEAYEIACNYSSIDKPTSIKIFFPKEDENKAQITISYGPTNDEDVLYQKSFDKREAIDKLLPEICNQFIINNGIVTNETFQVPNTTKGGSITLGANDSLLQMSNADIKDIEKIQMYLNNNKELEETSVLKK